MKFKQTNKQTAFDCSFKLKFSDLLFRNMKPKHSIYTTLYWEINCPKQSTFSLIHCHPWHKRGIANRRPYQAGVDSDYISP